MRNLTTELKNRLKSAKRIALLGVGSELRGDDAAGMLVVGALSKYARRKTHDARRRVSLRAFLGETAPENLTGQIIKFKPSHLIIVDAADIKQKAGTVLLLNAEELAEGVSFSTHKLPPKVMIDYFTRRIGCKTLIIGIQPKTLKFDSPVSKEVKSSAREVSGAIISAIKGAD